MGEKKKIDRWTFGYIATKKLLTQTSLWFYYKKIVINNRKNLPKNEPLILTSNHQNALLDALGITIWLKVPVVFMTRADIFAKPFLEKILRLYKMLPIFRIRDGRESLKKNEEIFNESVEVIHNKKSPLGIFPEGNHGEQRKLRTMVKGVFRIAFKAQEKYKEQPGVKLVPMGLDYEDYYKYGQNLFINIGKPIDVSDYWTEYEKSPAATTNKLREHLGQEIKKLMINITSEDHYETIQGMRTIARPFIFKQLNLHKNNVLNQFIADKYLTEELDKLELSDKSKVESLTAKYNEYIKLRSNLKLRDWVFGMESRSIFKSAFLLLFNVLLLPILLFGLFNNWPSFFIPPRFAKKAKDPQMRSTFSWAMGLIIALIYYPILIVLGFIFLPFLWMKLLYIPLIPFSGIFAFRIRNGIIKNYAKIRFILMKNKNTALIKAIRLYDEMIEIIKFAISTKTNANT